MEKKLVTLILTLLISSVSFAQLTVNEYGNVGIADTLSSTNCKLSIGNVSYNKVYNFGLSASNLSISSYNIGVEGSVIFSSPISKGRSYGVRGMAGNYTSGYNFGLAGILCGNNNGAGVYGSVNKPLGELINGKYAGYFSGDLFTTGAMKGKLANDYDAADQSQWNESTLALDMINEIYPISYVSSRPVHSSDTTSGSINGNSSIINNGIHPTSPSYHYGLNPQQVKSVIPQLVFNDGSENSYVNYTELVPILIKSIKELNEKIEYLSSLVLEKNAPSMHAPAATNIGNNTENETSVLYQNNPNPYTQRTTIKFRIPQNCNNAYIYIYDMRGVMLKQIEISAELGYVTIESSELAPGMYIYSLIVNNKEVDTKRMILSK